MLNIFHVRDSIFLKALNHPHFLHLVSALHKKGRVRYRRKKPARQTNTLYLSSLKGKAKKSHHCHPELHWKPQLFHQIVRRMLTPGECSTMGSEQLSQGHAVLFPAHLQLCSAVLFYTLLPFTPAQGFCYLFSWDSQ